MHYYIRGSKFSVVACVNVFRVLITDAIEKAVGSSPSPSAGPLHTTSSFSVPMVGHLLLYRIRDDPEDFSMLSASSFGLNFEAPSLILHYKWHLRLLFV